MTISYLILEYLRWFALQIAIFFQLSAERNTWFVIFIALALGHMKFASMFYMYMIIYFFQRLKSKEKLSASLRERDIEAWLNLAQSHSKIVIAQNA